MKTLLILTAFLSSSIALAGQLECHSGTDGDSLHLRVQSREEIKPAAISGIVISTQSPALMPDTSAGAAYEILAYAADAKAEHTAFDLWDGNWGMRIDVPHGALKSDVKAGTRFHVGYHYVFGKTETQHVTLQLLCVAQ